MLGKFTITVRLYLNAAISIGLIGVVGFVGYQGILHLTEANQTSATYAKAIRYQVEVDMFHDGIASVVNAALISGLRFDRPMYESARAGLEEHAKAMQDDISTVAGLPLDPEVKAKLEATLAQQERLAAGGGTSRQQAAAQKEADRIRKMLLELNEYEHDVLYPLASQQIVIDLDDGVKVNYRKFGAALKKIPGLEAGE